VIQSAAEPADSGRRVEAMLGKATALELKNDFATAAKTLEQIIEQSGENDSAVQAEACVRLGSAFQAAGNVRDALLAYLRVDVLYPGEKKAHAEALYHLSQLWARDGKPDRAADAATVLQAKYPESEWAKKVSSKTGT
jgi:TolA-binding protein